ncbi:MAG TPA: EAL domain-containing protein [Solirubrobacteraceae bacterium]|nr:EAL domain-containing protein [Solirubrobacteraceae bacterium]
MPEISHIAPASAEPLGDAEVRYRQLVERIPAVVYLCDSSESSFPFRYISPQVTQLLGVTPEELLADDELWYRSIHPDDVARVREQEVSCLARRVDFECEFRMIARDGSVRHVWEREALLPSPDAVPALAQGVIVDVTPLRVAENELRAERDRVQRYVDVAATTLLALDADGRVTMLNQAGHKMLGYDDGALLGVDWFETCVPAAERDRVRGAFELRMAHDDELFIEDEGQLLRKDGIERTIAWHTSALQHDGQNVGLLCSGVDITERRRAEEQVVYLAYHDSLTGLPNRTMLQEHLELALARARRNGSTVSLLYLDLDDFKLVNDGLGHSAGDELLCQVAARIRRHVREPDMLARQGGDEFLVLLADLEDDGEHRALTAAEHIVDAVREPYRIGGVEFEISASVGVSLFPADAQDAISLLDHADAAMYAAKAESRGQVRVFRTVAPRREQGVERLSESRRLRRAIEAGELTLHWQPIVRLADRIPVAVEALVRWNDPTRGLRTAAEFVPVAERSGTLDQLDDWVLGAFGEQRRAWRAVGLNPHVCFNLSPNQLRPERISTLLSALRDGGDLESVTVELTEGAAVRHDEAVASVLWMLRDAGLTLSLDGFGVAYSSLSQLAELPVQWIKVDGTFTRDVPEVTAATRLLHSIGGLIEALGLRAIVEGVETERQVVHMVQRGWLIGQGHYLAPPMPAAEVEPLLRASPAFAVNASAA